MSGYFIVSLDCEGKWGMADKLQPYHHRALTDAALARVYDDIVDMFGRHDIPATFAFVLAFVMNEAERAKFAHLFEVDDRQTGGWLSYFRDARRAGKVDGWFQPRALDSVQRHAQHEIACHGFCHRSLADGALSPDQARDELDAAELVAQHKGLTLRTFVYPRNKVGNLEVLAEKGYLGYRAERPHPPGRRARLRALAEELNLWPRPEEAIAPGPGQVTCIPAGFFFNWRFGPRRAVPGRVTVRRWKTLLERTAANGGVAHLWLHPHNLITAPDTRETLEPVLAHAAALRATRGLKIVTQETYCRQIVASRETAARGAR
jgi:peptidoglycan/xylan/chitin deacetylase (PgdA/CDA1 family)